MGVSYFDQVHFSNCLRSAIKKKNLSVKKFQEMYLPDESFYNVRNWTYGVCMPRPEPMQKLVDIFGWNRVKRWLRFDFDTTSKKQVS